MFNYSKALFSDIEFYEATSVKEGDNVRFLVTQSDGKLVTSFTATYLEEHVPDIDMMMRVVIGGHDALRDQHILNDEELTELSF